MPVETLEQQLVALRQRIEVLEKRIIMLSDVISNGYRVLSDEEEISRFAENVRESAKKAIP